MEIKDKIRMAMKEAGFTQQGLADVLGITNPVVNTWVTGKRNPTVRTLKKIAAATGKPLEYFLQEDDNSVNQQANGNSGVIMGNNNSNVNNVGGKNGSAELEELRQELRETRESLGDKITILEAKLDFILEKMKEK